MVKLKRCDEWLQLREYSNIIICDPDGWDRTHFKESWAEPISEEEFKRRLSLSTCIYNVDSLINDED